MAANLMEEKSDRVQKNNVTDKNGIVPRSTVTKTLVQYSAPLPEATVTFLEGIAEDYGKVKNYVYQRYSGIKSVNKLTPVYTILNEMRSCGLRNQLGLPSVYYELAVADAVADIKGNWGRLKNKISDLIRENKNLSPEDRLYLRTVLKIGSVFSAILKSEPSEMPDNAKGLDIDTKRLNNLLRRLVRRHLTVPATENVNTFRVNPNGYKYQDGGIYLVSRIPRKRVFIPLKDNRVFDRQILITMQGNTALLYVPIETKVKHHEDYQGTVYMHIGNRDMLTLSNGNIYGQDLEARVYPETLRLEAKNHERGAVLRNYKIHIAAGDTVKAGKIERNNLGKKKYESIKTRERAKTQDYINTELNRMLKKEKPARIIIPKPVTKNKTKIYSKTANLKLKRSFNGYIRKRLAFKCQINSIELIEINSKGTGSICSECGGEGKCYKGEFTCKSCGLNTSIGLNSARNIEKKYISLNHQNGE